MGPFLKFLALGASAAALCVAQARADALDDDYIRARNSYVARFDPGDREVDQKKVEAPLKRAREDLQKKLRRIVGEAQIKGVKGAGALNDMSIAWKVAEGVRYRADLEDT